MITGSIGERCVQDQRLREQRIRIGVVVAESCFPFAFDGFFAWPLGNGETKTISVEEMGRRDINGCAYLIPPQESMILNPSQAKR